MKESKSPPSRAAWIEIIVNLSGRLLPASPPSRAAWIEIMLWQQSSMPNWSPPSRAAWIEMLPRIEPLIAASVAAFTGGVD